MLSRKLAKKNPTWQKRDPTWRKSTEIGEKVKFVGEKKYMLLFLKIDFFTVLDKIWRWHTRLQHFVSR